MPIFEGVTAGWVDDDVGLLLFMDKVAEGGDIMGLCDALPAVVRKRTGTKSQVI